MENNTDNSKKPTESETERISGNLTFAAKAADRTKVTLRHPPTFSDMQFKLMLSLGRDASDVYWEIATRQEYTADNWVRAAARQLTDKECQTNEGKDGYYVQLAFEKILQLLVDKGLLLSRWEPEFNSLSYQLAGDAHTKQVIGEQEKAKAA